MLYLKDYIEAHDFSIIRPQYAAKNKKYDQWIEFNSARWQRVRVTQIRRYLSLECGYSMSMDESDDCWKNIEVYTFTEDILFCQKSGAYREALIGACCFDVSDKHANLEFVWLHPFWRNKGHLTMAWLKFSEKLGKFTIEPPLSKSMQSFLGTRHETEF